MARGVTSTDRWDQGQAIRCRSGIARESSDMRSIEYGTMSVVRRSINKWRARIQEVAWHSMICFSSGKMVVRGRRSAQEMHSDDEVGVNLSME